jgi:hypothetical protein
MVADWSVEIGPDLPVIDCSWEGFIDLRNPEAIDRLEEASKHPALRRALLLLNATNSPVFTTKCDTWTLPEHEIDAYEFDASAETSHAGFASYIDLVQRDSARFSSLAWHEQWAGSLTADLRQLEPQQGRSELVVREAIAGERQGYGITLYSAGCGADAAGAYQAWEAVLAATIAAAHRSGLGE